MLSLGAAGAIVVTAVVVAVPRSLIIIIRSLRRGIVVASRVGRAFARVVAIAGRRLILYIIVSRSFIPSGICRFLVSMGLPLVAAAVQMVAVGDNHVVCRMVA